MTRQTVYVETTIVSYLTARLSRDLVLAAKQQTTREWWDRRRGDFDLQISQLVLDEATQGDPEASERRLALLAGLPILRVDDEAIGLGSDIVGEHILPEKAARDALHLGVATARGVDYLLTWNCAHLANAEVVRVVNRFLRARGYEPPIICTPDELMGDEPCPETPS